MVSLLVWTGVAATRSLKQARLELKHACRTRNAGYRPYRLKMRVRPAFRERSGKRWRFPDNSEAARDSDADTIRTGRSRQVGIFRRRGVLAARAATGRASWPAQIA